MKRYPVSIPGYEGRLVLEHAGWFATPQLLLDDKPIEVLSRRNPFVLPGPNAEDRPVIGKFRYRFLDPIPKIQVAGQIIAVAPSFRWFEWILICLPWLLVFNDIILGALVGAIGSTINAQIFRQDWSQGRKVGIALLVDLASAILYVVILSAARLLLT